MRLRTPEVERISTENSWMRDAPLNNERLMRIRIFRDKPIAVRENIQDAPAPLFLLIVIGIVIRLVVNPAIVAEIYPYTTPGGLFLSHIHPGSYFLLFAGALSFQKVLSRTPKRANPLFWAAISLMLVCLISVFVNVIRGNGNVNFVVDSLFVAPVSLLAIANLSVRQQSLIGYILIAVILMNGGVSVVEVMLHRQILPEVHADVNYFGINDIFRPNGLFGHPLTTGGIAVPAMPLIFILVRDFFWKWTFVILMAVSVAIAQDRVATIASALILITLVVLSLNKDIKSGVVSARTALVALTLSALIIPAIIWALYSSGRFERLFTGTNDKSAAARVVVYDILKFMTPSEFDWGMRIDRATMLANSFLHIEHFESVVVIFVLSFGFYLTIIFLPLIYFFVISISLGSSLYVKAAAITFLVLASTNNALASPGPDFIIVTALAFIAAVRYRCCGGGLPPEK
jgi:hypothetical protein